MENNGLLTNDKNDWTDKAIAQKSDNKKTCLIAIVVAIVLLGTAGIIIGVVVSNNNDDGNNDKSTNRFDEYQTMTFTVDANLMIGDTEDNEWDSADSSSITIPVTTDCSSILETINGEVEYTVWGYWYFYNTNMPATSMNPLLYCLTTSGKMDAQTGWWGYAFVNWSGLDGTLD